jgi:hypothetical protein
MKTSNYACFCLIPSMNSALDRSPLPSLSKVLNILMTCAKKIQFAESWGPYSANNSFAGNTGTLYSQYSAAKAEDEKHLHGCELILGGNLTLPLSLRLWLLPG